MLSDQRLTRTPPKKLLALDGGGIRGLITLEILGKIEDLLQEAAGRVPNSSSPISSITSAARAPVRLSRQLCHRGCASKTCGTSTCRTDPQCSTKPAGCAASTLSTRDERLAASLRGVFGPDTRLGSGRLRTLLLLVLRNATTNSPWFVSNIPFAKYQQSESTRRQPEFAPVATRSRQHRDSRVLPAGGSPDGAKLIRISRRRRNRVQQPSAAAVPHGDARRIPPWMANR